MLVDGSASEGPRSGHDEQSQTPNASTSRRRPSTSEVKDEQLDRAPSADSEYADAESNARRSRMILRALEASRRVYGNSYAHGTSASTSIVNPPVSHDSFSTRITVPRIPGVEKWVDEVTRIYGPGSETRGETKVRTSSLLVYAANSCFVQAEHVQADLENGILYLKIDCGTPAETSDEERVHIR